jgi:hypothetical protein
MKELLVLGGIVFIILIIAGLPLMLLWNWLMPTIFGLPEITFWQAVGLNMLSGILFKLNYTKSKE